MLVSSAGGGEGDVLLVHGGACVVQDLHGEEHVDAVPDDGGRRACAAERAEEEEGEEEAPHAEG